MSDWKCREKNCFLVENQHTREGSNSNEKIKINARCHHCGKPLCQDHAVLIVDDAFSVDEPRNKTLIPSWWHRRDRSLRPKAYHCKGCLKKYHPSARRVN